MSDPKIPFLVSLKAWFLYLQYRFWQLVYDLFFSTDHTRMHISVSLKDFNLKFVYQSHESYLKDMAKELRQLKRTIQPDLFVEQAVRRTRKCQFIIFSGKNEDHFVQFWLAEKSLYSSWPVLETNGLRKYTLAMLGVLNELHITQTPRVVGELWPFKYTMRYGLQRTEGFDDYIIVFGKDYAAVAAFTNRVMTDVFGEKLEDLKFSLG